MADSNQRSVQINGNIEEATCNDTSDSLCTNIDVTSSSRQRPFLHSNTELFDQDRVHVVNNAHTEEPAPFPHPYNQAVAAIATATAAKIPLAVKDSRSEGFDDASAPSQNLERDTKRSQNEDFQQLHQVHGVVYASLTPESIVLYVTILFFIVIISSYAIWHQRNQRRTRREWLESSDRVLNALRHGVSAIDFPHRHETKDDIATLPERSNGIPNESACKNLSENPEDIDILNNQSFTNASGANTSESTSHELSPRSKYLEASPAPNSKHIHKIRALQQQNHETNIQSRRRKLKERQRILHDSLQHDVAEGAYQRRLAIMAEERQLLMTSKTMMTSASIPQHDNQTGLQPPLNQEEEMERAALLHQQNLDYQESLDRDRQQAREVARRNESKLKRRKLIRDAERRLISEGVDTFGLLEGCHRENYNCKDEARSKSPNRSMVRIRLHLPSGKRVQGVFLSGHVVGLIYDLALVALDKEELFVNNGHENDVDSIAENRSEENPSDCDNANPIDSAFDYRHVQSEWKEVFPQFSIVHSMLRRSLDELGIPLEECCLTSSAMLMVVVDSD